MGRLDCKSLNIADYSYGVEVTEATYLTDFEERRFHVMVVGG